MSSPLTHLSITSVLAPPSPADPVPWPSRAGQHQLWPVVRRLRQRLSVTPTGSRWCLDVVLAREWRVQSARRGGEALMPWLLHELALSRAEVTAEGPVLVTPPTPPARPGHHRYCCNGCHKNTRYHYHSIFVCARSQIHVKLLSSSKVLWTTRSS